MVAQQTSDSVCGRLLKAVLDRFLADDYQSVTTQRIAQQANANVSMIRYSLGNKDKLYEKMVQETVIKAVSENRDLSPLFTLDSDFYIYRLRDGSTISLIP